jgi:deoxyribonuclease-4
MIHIYKYIMTIDPNYIKDLRFVNNTFYYGCHMPVSNGIDKAILGIHNMGGNCLQIFVSNPMSGKVTDKAMQFYKERGSNIQKMLNEMNVKLFIHSPYTLNFAKDKINNSWASCYWITALINELEIAHHIGAVGCVIHVGKSLDLNIDIATNNMHESLLYVIEQIKIKKLNSIIILETGAGQGTEMFLTENNTIDGFANFYNLFTFDEKQYIKTCVDTCHIYSAGYCISSRKICQQFFAEFQEKIGLENLVLIHLNDSKKECCAKVDRHENLGKGHIGQGINAFISFASSINIPLILETPEPNPKEILAIKEIERIRKEAKRAKKESIE